MKGRAELTTFTAASSVTSSVHQDAVTTHPRQSKVSPMWMQSP